MNQLRFLSFNFAVCVTNFHFTVQFYFLSPPHFRSSAADSVKNDNT